MLSTNNQDIVDVSTYTKLRAAVNHIANSTMIYHYFSIYRLSPVWPTQLFL